MPRPAIKDGLSKQARYRAAKRAAGLKEVRIWAFDTSNPEFMAKLKRDMAAIRESDRRDNVMDLIESITAYPRDDQ